MRPTSVLATLTGRDRPGVTAAFFAALAAHDVDVRDVEQVMIRGRLILTVLCDLRGDASALRSSATTTARALGMECELTIADQGARPDGAGGLDDDVRGSDRCHVIVLGHPLRAGSVSHIAQSIADQGANIESIAQLSFEPAASLELLVRTPDPAGLRAALVQAADDTGVDVAVESAGLRRRAKRLILLDVDSTFIREDAVDVLSERAGVRTQVEAVTARAMAGELDFESALRERAALLAGLPVAEVEAVRDALQLTPGACAFVRTLHTLGFRVGVVSGGFGIVTDRFVAELGLDFSAANELEIADGIVTGRVTGPVLDRRGKAEVLRRFAADCDVPLSQTVAVGDGANDIDMIGAAGLGIAFNAKSALRAAADCAVHLPYLDSVLFVLGLTRAEIAQAGV